ncbi:hypothetical protein QJS10_CPA01g01914 [Acorus calamus]|uniref:Uncharacterized protein n=1 Tax=Acorus calamus TaxID=4465 RepID=A0AAV9FM01_ACOCL|nr:hypothetical protein QJS10_CPA01g01914 [Acorus calamus]
MKSFVDKEEMGPLSEEVRNRRCAIKVEWNMLLSLEEAEWRKRSRETWLKEGDESTKFFHKVGSQRRRANKILKMQFGEVVTEHLPDIEQGLVNHFKVAYQRRRAGPKIGSMKSLGGFQMISGNLLITPHFLKQRPPLLCTDIPMPGYGVPGEASRPPSTLRELPEGRVVPLIEKFTQRLEGWKGKLLSSGEGGRFVLLQVVLSNLTTYFLSLFKIPKGILQKIEGLRRRFLWSGPSFDQRKVHLVKEIVCNSKRADGLGVLNLEDMNKALLRGAPQPSKIWNGILSATPCFVEVVGWEVGNGRAIRFWHDQWVGDTPLKSKFPELFTIATDKEGLVEQFWMFDSEGG